MTELCPSWKAQRLRRSSHDVQAARLAPWACRKPPRAASTHQTTTRASYQARGGGGGGGGGGAVISGQQLLAMRRDMGGLTLQHESG